MNFLAPLFLIGALAVAGPVIYHLVRRTTRERLPFGVEVAGATALRRDLPLGIFTLAHGTNLVLREDRAPAEGWGDRLVDGLIEGVDGAIPSGLGRSLDPVHANLYAARRTAAA